MLLEPGVFLRQVGHHVMYHDPPLHLVSPIATWDRCYTQVMGGHGVPAALH
jgi:hypothetical protein